MLSCRNRTSLPITCSARLGEWRSTGVSLDGNSQMLAGGSREDRGAAEKPMSLPKRKKDSFACVVHRGDTVKINLDLVRW